MAALLLFINGNNIGINSPSLIIDTLKNNDVVSCILNSNASFVFPASASSNDITMTVNANVSPSMYISPSINNICSGTSVTFSSTPTNGGITPIFQ